ncbi:MAG: helix-turn-helix domain-containing protein [Nitrososphaerales archaeon]
MEQNKPIVQEVVDKLIEYGLTERQAKLYIYLVINGSMKLNEIAHITGLHRMQAYRVLKQLIELGIVEATLTRPSTYSALPPKEALNLLLDEVVEHTQRLKENMAFTLEALKALTNSSFLRTSSAKFKVIQGRKQTFKLVKQICKKAQVEINNINTRNGIVRCVRSGLDEICEECAKRGVKTRWLADVDSRNIAEVKRLCEFGEVRHMQIPSSIRLIVVDESETLLSSVYDDSINLTTGGDVTFWTNDKNVSKLMNLFFYSLWKEAKKIKTLDR